MTGGEALGVTVHVYDDAGVEKTRGLIRGHPQDGNAVAVFTEEGAYAVERVRFVRRHAVVAVAAVGCAIAAAAAHKVKKVLGSGCIKEETSVVGSTRRVRDDMKRLCQVWAKYERVHGRAGWSEGCDCLCCAGQLELEAGNAGMRGRLSGKEYDVALARFTSYLLFVLLREWGSQAFRFHARGATATATAAAADHGSSHDSAVRTSSLFEIGSKARSRSPPILGFCKCAH